MSILNFGSLNIDHVYHVDHFVRPGETISAERLDYFSGGKGLNQSIALAKAGANVYHAGKIGVDGESLKQILSDNGVHTDYIEMTNGVNGHALIQVVPSGQNNIIIYGGSNHEITEEYADRVLEHFGEGDLVLMQNETSSIDYIARKCAQKKIKIAINPSPISKKLLDTFPFELVSLFFINEIEGRELSGKEKTDEILDSLLEKYPNSAFVLTLGHNGVVYRDKNNTFTHGIYDIKVVDTTAAGDTFTGYFLACYAAGEPVPDCLRKASIASSLAVSRPGAAPSIPRMAEVREATSHLKYVEFQNTLS
ncbi:MAG: ribokinase [Clostridiales bacterium]|jgi:ribokinase|nr:ribokinase [Clostridiales bacterium]